MAQGKAQNPSDYFSEESQYFFTYTVGGLRKDAQMTWSITPFVITLDGTKVIGEAGVWPKS